MTDFRTLVARDGKHVFILAGFLVVIVIRLFFMRRTTRSPARRVRGAPGPVRRKITVLEFVFLGVLLALLVGIAVVQP